LQERENRIGLEWGPLSLERVALVVSATRRRFLHRAIDLSGTLCHAAESLGPDRFKIKAFCWTKAWLLVADDSSRLRLQTGSVLVCAAAPMAVSSRSGDNGRARKRVLLQVLRGTADANVRFEDLRALLGALGFAQRIKGDHHMFSKPRVAEILHLQPRGLLAKRIRSSRFAL
jgi:hypothetical protein